MNFPEWCTHLPASTSREALLDRLRQSTRWAPTLIAAVLTVMVGSGPTYGAGPIITEFSVPNATPYFITTGPDGNLWLTLPTTQIGIITTAGTIKDTITLPKPPPSIFPPFLGNMDAYNNIVTGPDGNLWFCEGLTQKIARLTPAGIITEFPVPNPPSTTNTSQPAGITVGPDGALWFTDPGTEHIGRITTDGVIQEYPLGSGNGPLGITAGPDGNLWFANVFSIGRITPQGSVTFFPTISSTALSFATNITPGPDGNLWFTSGANGVLSEIGRITTDGVVTGFPLPDLVGTPLAIVAGPDGNLWFTESRGAAIGSITTSGIVAEYPTPTKNSGPIGITVGPDGNLWFTEPNVRKVARVRVVGGACTANSTTLCIDDKPGDKRWQLTTTFSTSQGGSKSGSADAISLSSLGVTKGGLFWFFDATNPEMLVKVIDACALNQHFWVFYAATTNVGFNIIVQDTRSGAAKSYTNVDGLAASPGQDTSAFPCANGDLAPDSGAEILPLPAADASVADALHTSAALAEQAALSPSAVEKAACTANGTTLCVNGRFSIQAAYKTAQGGSSSGSGHALALQSLGVSEGGLFWFFDPTNPEMLIKVIDACSLNNHFWVFYAATTNVGFTVTVTDVQTGHKHQYANTDGSAAGPIQDTAALPCP